MTYYHECECCGHLSRSEWGHRFHIASEHAGLFDRYALPDEPTLTPLTRKYFDRLRRAIAQQQFAACAAIVRQERREP